MSKHKRVHSKDSLPEVVAIADVSLWPRLGLLLGAQDLKLPAVPVAESLCIFL